MKRYQSLFENKELKLGRILFGDFRKKKERDTKLEKEIFNTLSGYVGSKVYSKRKLAQMLLDLKAVQDKYPDVLKPAKKGVYYRMVGIKGEKQKDLKKQIMISGYKGYDRNDPSGKLVVKDIIYNTQSPFESWTTDFKVAEKFHHGQRDFGAPVILRAIIPEKQMIFNSKFMNLLAKEVLGVKESEVLRISKEPIKVDVLLNKELHKML